MLYPENKNIEIDVFNGLLVDYMEKTGAVAIIRGLRAVSDFEYEMQMASINKHLNRRVETVFLRPMPNILLLVPL